MKLGHNNCKITIIVPSDKKNIVGRILFTCIPIIIAKLAGKILIENIYEINIDHVYA